MLPVAISVAICRPCFSASVSITMALVRKPTDLGHGKLKDDFEILDEDRRSIGRITLHPHAPPGRPWLWTITSRAPQQPHDRGYAESREQAMANFEMAWQRKSVVVRGILAIAPLAAGICRKLNFQQLDRWLLT
jgi:hypothetical protein